MKKRRELTNEEKKECAILKKIWDDRKDTLRKKGEKFTQELALVDLGFETQGAISQYLNGGIALNVDAILKFATLLECHPEEIRPSITKLIPAVNSDHTIKSNAHEASKVNEKTAIYSGLSNKITELTTLLSIGVSDDTLTQNFIPQLLKLMEQLTKTLMILTAKVEEKKLGGIDG